MNPETEVRALALYLRNIDEASFDPLLDRAADLIESFLAERATCDERVKAARREALEEAAKVCEQPIPLKAAIPNPFNNSSWLLSPSHNYARAIRALQTDDTGTTESGREAVLRAKARDLATVLKLTAKYVSPLYTAVLEQIDDALARYDTDTTQEAGPWEVRS